LFGSKPPTLLELPPKERLLLSFTVLGPGSPFIERRKPATHSSSLVESLFREALSFATARVALEFLDRLKKPRVPLCHRPQLLEQMLDLTPIALPRGQATLLLQHCSS